jgi:hypothetical protein
MEKFLIIKNIKNLIKNIFGLSLTIKLFLFLNYKNYFKNNLKLNFNSKLKKKIIFLVPEGKIFIYFLYHAFFGKLFEKLGYEVFFLKCYKNLSYCKILPHDYLSPLQPDFVKYFVCNSCNNLTNNYLAFFKFNIINLKNLNTQKIFFKVNKLNTLNKIKNYIFQGIKIGQLSLYDFHINQKASDLSNLKKSDYEVIKNYILSITNLILNLKEIIKNNFEHFIILDEYSSDLASRIFLKKKKLSVFRSCITYHKNEDLSFLSLSRTSSVIEENYIKLKYWKYFKKLPLNRNIIKGIEDDLIIKIFNYGTHNFSKNKSDQYIDLYNKFSINKNKKVVVLFSSSEDELSALSVNYKYLKLTNERKLFKSNFHWIDETISFFSKLDDSHLIIKFHPRIGKTFRENHRSSIYNIYKNKYFNSSFKNVTILEPETLISSYDLADICDLALTGWGNIGLELARLGVPVIVAMQSFMSNTPNINLLKSPKNKNDYFNLINEKINNFQVLKISDIIAVFRWYYLYKLSNAFFEKNLENWEDYKQINYNKFSKNNLKGFNKILTDKSMKKEIIEINYNSFLKNKSFYKIKKEKNEIKKFIKRISNKYISINKNSKISLRLSKIVNN